MKPSTLNLKTVCECNRSFNCRTLHPQISVINLQRPDLEHDAVKFEFYAILFIEKCEDGCGCCGRRADDYTCATMVFLQPGEIFRMSEAGALPDKGWLLAFHPDLLYRTPLKNHLGNYTFFSYRKEEALHLSQREAATVTDCMQHIADELQHAVDTHSATILSRLIELMLDYCTRFYERQFITRQTGNQSLLERLDSLFEQCIRSGALCDAGLFTAAFCAAKLGLSTPYFQDLLKFETGKTLDEYFQLKRLEAAKGLLLKAGNTPADVARRLGYESVQYFSLLFKKCTGISPNQYRCSRN